LSNIQDEQSIDVIIAKNFDESCCNNPSSLKQRIETLDSLLKKNGCVLLNLSIHGRRTNETFRTLKFIVEQTPFTVMDVIVSKIPNNETNTIDVIFVLCRKSESKIFFMNKKSVSARPTGQLLYENIFNFMISSSSNEFLEKVLEIYSIESSNVFDVTFDEENQISKNRSKRSTLKSRVLGSGVIPPDQFSLNLDTFSSI